MCTCCWTRGCWGARSPARICTWCVARTRTGHGPSRDDSGWCRWISLSCRRLTVTSSSGAPVRPDAVGELLAAASRRAGLAAAIRPHQLRHAFGSNLVDAGSGIDVVADLLGHVAVSSSGVYLHPDPARLRAAVESVPSPREQAAVGR